MNFSIKQLLFGFAVVGVGLVGLLNARWPAARLVVELVTLAVVVTMAYGVWYTAGAERAFRFGFLGWWILYSVPLAGLSTPSRATALLLEKAEPVFRPRKPEPGPSTSNTHIINDSFSLSTTAESLTLPSGSTPSGPLLLESPSTTEDRIILRQGESPMDSSIYLPPQSLSFSASGPAPDVFMVDDRWRIRYYAIGHCLAGVLIGLLGGWFTVFFVSAARGDEGGVK